MGDLNCAVLAVIAAVEGNVDVRLKPHTFWTRFHGTVITLLRALTARARLAPLPDAPEVSQTTTDAAPPPDTATTAAMDTDAAPLRAGSPTESLGSSGDGTRDNVPNAGAPTATAPDAPALERPVMLKLAAFWLKLALWLSEALAQRPDAADVAPDWAPAGGSDGKLLSTVLAQVRRLLLAQGGALLAAVAASPAFAALMRDMLFHTHEASVRLAAKELLEATVLCGPPAVQLGALQVRQPPPPAPPSRPSPPRPPPPSTGPTSSRATSSPPSARRGGP